MSLAAEDRTSGGEAEGDGVPDEPSGGVAGGPRRRPRTVLYTSIAVAAVAAVFVALLASSHSSGRSSPLIGKPAPPVSGARLGGGGPVGLSDFTGRWVLVNFAASWCQPCVAETPELEKFASEHRARGDAQVLGVAFDPADVGRLAAFLRQSRATWPAVDDLSAEVGYGVTQIPQSFLVDPRGTVVAKFFGGVTASQLDRAIVKASTPR